jgi:hypothetical protein
MPDNEKDLFQWQLGTQATFDTAVTPTVKLMGITGGSLKPAVEGSHVEEQRGTLTPAYNATPDKISAEASIEFDACYEDLGYWLDAFFGTATPSGTDPYTREYLGAGDKPSPRVVTIVHGSSSYVKELVGGVLSKLELSCESNKRMTGKADLIAHSVAAGSLATLADRAVNFLHSNQTTLYIDGAGGSFGGTEVTCQKFSTTLSLDANRMLKFGCGSLNPVGWGQKKADPSGNQMKIALAVDTQSYAHLASILTTDMSSGLWKPLIRVKNQISADYSLTIDFAGFAADYRPGCS